MKFPLHLLVALGLAAVPVATVLHAAGLEDMAEGSFRATGLVRQQPGDPAERVFCRLDSGKTEAARILIAGRCATAASSRQIRLEIAIAEPGRRYTIEHAEGLETHGVSAAGGFSGLQTGNETRFSANTVIEGTGYNLHLSITAASGKIKRLVETARPLDGGEPETLLDVTVRAD